MIKYKLTYKMYPIFINEQISSEHFEKIKTRVINIFYDNSFVDVNKKTKNIRKCKDK